MTNPTYVVFDDTYDAADIARLLGSVVTNVGRPLANYAPRADKSSAIDAQASYIEQFNLDSKVEDSVTIKTKSIRGTSAFSSLLTFFEFEKGWENADLYELNAREVRTYCIQQHVGLFEALMEARGEEVDEFFRRYGSKGLYMLVGFKVATDPSVTIGKETSRETSTGVNSEGMVLAATGIPGDLGIGFSRNRTVGSYLRSNITGERAFAGQYIKIVQKSRLVLSPTMRITLRREPLQKGLAEFNNKKMVFAGGSDSDDSDDDERSGGEANAENKADILY
ncbi:hypothetical protein TWF281_005137 [Arthrobotrys megalospora]